LALAQLARAALAAGDLPPAREYLAEGLALQRGNADTCGLLFSLDLAVGVALHLGDVAQAEALLEEARRLGGMLGQAPGAAAAQRQAARLAILRGDWEAARHGLGFALAFSEETGSRAAIALDLLALADLALRSGGAVDAAGLYAQSLAHFREIGDRLGTAAALLGMGRSLTLGAGDAAGAQSHLREALQLALEMGAQPVGLAALAALGRLWVAQGRPLPAAELLTFVLYHPASSRQTQDDASQVLSRLEAEVPAAEIALAEERGRRGELAQLAHAVLSADGLSR
jgi:tetratricopeptide (TPR) repeat protein